MKRKILLTISAVFMAVLSLRFLFAPRVYAVKRIPVDPYER
jgi:hypothetical protein